MFSSFQNSIQCTSLSLDGQKTIYVKLEESDQDPGRFWLKLIASLRILHLGNGKEVLDRLVDNHSFPTAGSLNIFAKDLKNQRLTLVVDKIEFVSSQPWWQKTRSWLNDAGLIVENNQAGSDLYSTAVQITDDNQPSKPDMENLEEWLNTTGEWLQGLRWYLEQKEFEEAGDILEQYAEEWLNEGFDPLELLFWLREIPSVLLTARPVLCWLAVKSCHMLGLKFLVGYYCNAAENSLASFSRFTRDEEQWKGIEINDHGLTVGELLVNINQLKGAK
jgi:hypothetical protein